MSNSKIYFINYSEETNAIRSTEVKMFYKLKDLKSFINSHGNLSGYVTRIGYNGNTETEKSILGFLNGFNPGAMEGEIILRVLGRRLTNKELNKIFKF